MEAKEGEAKADASLLSEVARYFKDQAFMCSKDEGSRPRQETDVNDDQLA